MELSTSTLLRLEFTALSETMQSCEGAIKSLRSARRSAGENFSDIPVDEIWTKEDDETEKILRVDDAQGAESIVWLESERKGEERRGRSALRFLGYRFRRPTAS